MNNMNKFLEYREKYQEFIYDNYEIKELTDTYLITYTFVISSLCVFHPTIEIPKKNEVNEKIFNNMVFNIGLVELLSYVKATCSKNIIIKCGYLNAEQIEWWKNLYYHGLGEFLYTNNISITKEDLFNIRVIGNEEILPKIVFEKQGNLIPVGGGKDSNVTMELLKGLSNTPFVINPSLVHEECIKVAGYDDYFVVKRNIDPKIKELNEKEFLNGHTPFSALVAFVSYLSAYINHNEYICLSNESSANEPTVLGTNINHQYSKSYAFEKDFNYYASKYLGLDIKYFSLLRAYNETQIAYLFSTYKKYHSIFKSCNVGSKTKPWKWCQSCAKCLFVYIILSPYLNKEELISIFGEDLFTKEDLLDTFLALLGHKETKPFECVGTYEEIRDVVSKTIKKYDGVLPYLLKYYQDNYPLEEQDFINDFNEENFIPEEFLKLLKEAIKKNA